mmetsp:Transcript_28473/g.41574  ORF Transcript_28473/g.41574 Transcript_28473/m.41574 type:complete len:501 (-) Transcript_28473:264-1766(-)
MASTTPPSPPINNENIMDSPATSSYGSVKKESLETDICNTPSSSASTSPNSSYQRADSIDTDEEEGLLSKGDDGSAINAEEGKATISNEVFNLIKNLVGAGALGLPSGVAAFANAPSALIPASFITIFMGIVFGYYFHLMGRICNMTSTSSYRDAWEHSVGLRGSSLIAAITVFMAGLGNLAYSMILADTTRSLLAAVGIERSRTFSLIVVTVFALFPLCLVKQLKALAPFSLVGLVGMGYTMVAMAIRYFDGTYDIEKDGIFLKDIPDDMKPSFGTTGASGVFTAKSLLLVCMTFQAFFAHYNAPRYYIELQNATSTRFGYVVSSSFGLSALIYIAMTVFGFLTFGSNSAGFILNNYSDQGTLATISRLCIAVSLLFTYPLPFMGVRDGILDILLVPSSARTDKMLNLLTVVILLIFTLLAMHFKDLGMVNAVGGGTLGTAVVFIFPTLMFRAIANRNLKVGAAIARQQQREVMLLMSLMCFGILVGSIGVYVAIFPDI